MNKKGVVYVDAARKRLKIRDEKEEEAYRLRKPSQRLRKDLQKWFRTAAATAIKRTIRRQQLKEIYAEAARQAERRRILLRSRQRAIRLSPH